MTKVSNHKRGSHIWFYKYGLKGGHQTHRKSNWIVKELSEFLQEFNETHVRFTRCRGAPVSPLPAHVLVLALSASPSPAPSDARATTNTKELDAARQARDCDIKEVPLRPRATANYEQNVNVDDFQLKASQSVSQSCVYIFLYRAI